MDQFGIDLDKVLNDFEEQENLKELEDLIVPETKNETTVEESLPYSCKSQISESTSEAKISKNCLPSTNNILSSLNKYCKHFLRENVVNHVCCNDSRFHGKSPSKDVALPKLVAEGFPLLTANELDLTKLESAESMVESSESVVESSESVVESLSRAQKGESNCCMNDDDFYQKCPSEICISIENIKPMTLKNSVAITVKEDFLNLDLLQVHLLMNSSDLDGHIKPSKCEANYTNLEELPRIETEIIFPKVECDSLTEVISTACSEIICEDSIDHSNPAEYQDIARDYSDKVIPNENIAMAIHEFKNENTIIEETNNCTEFIVNTPLNATEDLLEALAQEVNPYFSEENEIKKDTDQSNCDVNEPPLEEAANKHPNVCTEFNIGNKSSISQRKEEDFLSERSDVEEVCLSERSDVEENCLSERSNVEEVHLKHPPQDDEFDEDTFVKLSEAEMNCHPSGVNGTILDAFIDVGAFNLSDVIDEYKDGDDEDDVTLKTLQKEAATFIEELKNGDIINELRDHMVMNHENASVGDDENYDKCNDKSMVIPEKSVVLLHEEDELLDELNKHENNMSSLEKKLEPVSFEDDTTSSDDLKNEVEQLTINGSSNLGSGCKAAEAFDFLRGSVQDEIHCCESNEVLTRTNEPQMLVASQTINSNECDRESEELDMESSKGYVITHISPEEQNHQDEFGDNPDETFEGVPKDSMIEVPEIPPFQQEERMHPSSDHPVLRPGTLQVTQPQFFHAPSRCANIDLPITELGKVSPSWLPDSSTNKCLQCETLFSFLRRRHHCRACGLIFCNECCNVRFPLEYMNKKEERVCCKCFVDFNRASSYQNMLSSMCIPTRTSRPSPNNTSEYCSTIPPPLQATPSDPLPPVMVPTGVLRKKGTTRQATESKQVMFSDGIRPGGDLTHLDERPEGTSNSGSKKKKSSKSSASLSKRQTASSTTPPGSSKQVNSYCNQNSFWSEGTLPPLAVYSALDFGYVLDKNMNSEEIFKLARDVDDRTPVMFCLNANLTVLVKVIKKMCCVKRDLWCFSTQGMSTIGQEEVVILMEFNQSETSIPLDVFHAISSVYASACSGTPIKNLGSIILPMTNSQEICGFLFINQTIQCIQNILLPDPPYLFGVFIKQVELTWARAFPLRLFFRLGAEFRYYPCPLFGVRDRAPVYGEVGHTIMNLLADFRNFQYSLSAVDDMVIHVEDKHTTVFIPRHKHHQVLKALSNSDDHVLALAGNFSSTADSHLICTQNPEGSYQTQAMNIQGKIRSVTGASFVIFNGALKLASGYTAKMSIIEDGLMIQITPKDMASLKQALTAADDMTINCGLSSFTSPTSPGSEGVFDGVVSLTWFSDQVERCSDIKSPIDGLNLSQLDHKRIHSSSIHATSDEGLVLIWTGLFFLNPSCASQTLRPEIERFSESLASSCCKCLTSHIASLFPPPLSKLSIRIKVSPDQIGYEAGMNGSHLSNECMVALDNVIIPLLHGSSFASRPYDTSAELLFVIAKPINA